MPHQTEPSANNALGRLLQRMLPGCEVMAEQTRVIDGHPGLTARHPHHCRRPLAGGDRS